jgi:hypothetical protein
MKHRHRVPILAAALLVTIASVALAGQENSATSQQTSGFSSSPAPTAPKFKPASPARSASPAKSAKSKGECTIASCVKLIGVGL